jgi:glyoxylase-like metal-dependent hydrolase (beta-lactamase superfamily II)
VDKDAMSDQVGGKVEWEIIALDTGSSVVEKSMLTYSIDFGIKVRIPRVMWVLKGPTTIVVDTSVGRDGKSTEFIGEPVERTKSQDPGNALADAGVDPRDVSEVILTHLHWDHAGNCDMFPDARVLVQDAELRYAIAPGRFFHRAFLSPQSGWGTPPYLVPRLETVDGEVEVAPGLRVVPTPGHTPGSQAVVVSTALGTFCIAGDTVSLYDNIERDVPSGFHVDVDESVDSIDRLRGLADHFLPSHDYQVFDGRGPTVIGPRHTNLPAARRDP